MSEYVTLQAHIFVLSCKAGVLCAFVYDLIRIFRRIMVHKLLTVNVEDILFWIWTGNVFFKLLYQYSKGTLRFYIFLGAVIGAVSYSLFIGRFLLKGFTKFWQCFRIKKNGLTGFLKVIKILFTKRS